MPMHLLTVLVALLSGFAPQERPGGRNLAASPPDAVARSCSPGSPGQAEARQLLDALHADLRRARDADSADALVKKLRLLLGHACFAMAVESPRWPAPDSIPSLRTWWDSGGAAWLEAYLQTTVTTTRQLQADDGPPEKVTSSYDSVVLPPDARRTLTPASAASPILASLGCPLEDSGCGAETAGWRERAETYFEYFRLRETQAARASRHEQAAWQDAAGDGRPPAVADNEEAAAYCGSEAASASKADRYVRFRNCLEQLRPLRPALPLGRIRAPIDGWLVVEGRRGHYEFCDTLSALSLQDGSAYVAESCSGLALRKDGSVDFEATRSSRRERVTAGRVPADNLREAVWLLVLSGRVENLQARAEEYRVPPGLDMVWRGPAARPTPGTPPAWFSTAQTSLHWRWLRADRRSLGGEITWPTSSDGASDYAAHLLDVVEKGLVSGCPPSPAPAANVLWGSTPGVSRGDADAGELDRLYRGLSARLADWSRMRPCASR